MSDPPKPVLAISPENDTAHIGPPDVLLKHLAVERPTPESGKRVIQWEFYDANGVPLTAQDDGAGTQVLVPTDPNADPPDRAQRQLLVRRIGVALQNAQLRLDAFFAKVEPGPDDRTQMVTATGELDDVLVMLSALEALEVPAAPHPGSWMHNWLDAVFGRR